MFDNKTKIKIITKVIEELKEAVNDFNFDGIGLCFYLGYVGRKFNRDCDCYHDNMGLWFPEIYKHRPIDATAYWFERDEAGYRERIKICRAAIKELKQS